LPEHKVVSDAACYVKALRGQKEWAGLKRLSVSRIGVLQAPCPGGGVTRSNGLLDLNGLTPDRRRWYGTVTEAGVCWP